MFNKDFVLKIPMEFQGVSIIQTKRLVRCVNKINTLLIILAKMFLMTKKLKIVNFMKLPTLVDIVHKISTLMEMNVNLQEPKIV